MVDGIRTDERSQAIRAVKIRILATGPSMSQALADSMRGLNVIVVNDAYKLFPNALAVCAQDHRWWDVHEACRENFKGRKFSANSVGGTERIVSQFVGQSTSSGVLSLEVARTIFGATEIELHGFDHQGSHYFGNHLPPLRNTTDERYKTFSEQFAAIAISLKASGIKVINKTPGSALECFERG
jgi:hypothetical protein